MLHFLVLVALFTAVVGRGEVCTEDTHCGGDECCQIIHLVASRKRGLSNDPSQGTCEPYKHYGDKCNVFDKLSGFCSCDPNLHCRQVAVPIPDANATNSIGKRRIVAPPPGQYWKATCDYYY